MTADTLALDAAWPLFALRIRSERLVLRLPDDDDLQGLMAVAKASIHPPDEMPFGIAWSTAPSPEWERDWLDARVALTDAFLDNVASSGVSRSLGYEENVRGALAPEGVARETQRFRMTAEAWRSRPRPPIEVDGFDACRDMFGV